MKKEIIIIGADDAIELVEISLQDKNYSIKGYLRQEKSNTGLSSKYPYLGDDSLISKKIFSNHYFVLALSLSERSKILSECIIENEGHLISIVHPSAVIYPSAEIANGTIILPNAIVSSMAVVGRCVNINYSVLVGHDVTVGNFSFLSPGVKLLGGSRIGSCCNIGTNAIVFPNVEVGEGCTIAANTVVTKNIPSGSTVISQHGKNRILKG